MKKNEAISILATSARPREPKNRKRYDEAVKMAIEALQPEQKKGKWNQIISIPNDMFGRYYCSECGKEGIPFWYFCPYCGADMREGEEE